MSTRDREPEVPGPLKYAPKWARMAAPQPEPATGTGGDRPASEPRAANRPAAGTQSRSGRKPRCASRRHGPREAAAATGNWRSSAARFEGDVAIKELRERMALAPDQPPEPPLRDDGGAAFGMVGRLAGLVALAAVAAYGFVWISTPRDGLADSGFALAAVQNAPFGQSGGASGQPCRPRSGEPERRQLQAGGVPASGRPGRQADSAHGTRHPAVDRPQLLAPVPWPAPDAGRDLADDRPRDPDHRRRGACRCARAPGGRAAAAADTSRAEIAIAPPPAAAPGSQTRTSRLFSPAAAPISPMAMSPPHASRFAAPPKAAMRRPRSRWAAPSIRWSSGASAPSGSRPMRTQARSWYQKAAELGSRDAPQRLDQLAQSTRKRMSRRVPFSDKETKPRQRFRPAAGRCWCRASGHSATAGTIAPAPAACRPRSRGRTCRTAGSAAPVRASSIRRPRSHGAQRPRRHIASRSAGAGSSSRSAATGSADKPSPPPGRGLAPGSPRRREPVEPGPAVFIAI